MMKDPGSSRIRQPIAQSQHERFVEAARKLGTDEDEAAFKEKLGVIARQKPKKGDMPETAPTKSRPQKTAI